MSLNIQVTDRLGREYHRVLKDETTLLLVVEGDDLSGLVGYRLDAMHSSFVAASPVVCVEELDIDPAYRSKDHGRALINGFSSWAENDGCVSLAR